MNKKDRYDKRAVYTNKIAPIIRELKVQCNLERMPMFVTVAVANDEKHTTYMNEMILSSADVNLTENAIGRLLLFINEFDVELPGHVQRSIRILTEYLTSIRLPSDAASRLELSLTDDKITAMTGIVKGKNQVVPSKDIVGTMITDEFYDD